MEAVAQRLERSRPEGLILGINLGCNKDTPLEEAPQDYLAVLDRLAPWADYFTVNVSSPNTPGLRSLQQREPLERLLRAVIQRRDLRAQERGQPLPLLLKLSPDLELEAIEEAIGLAEDRGVDGLILHNTTLARDRLKSAQRDEQGGLSGAPLIARSREILSWAVSRTRLPVVSVGGIMQPWEAQERLDRGASLVQLWTGLVYEGPSLLRRIVAQLPPRALPGS